MLRSIARIDLLILDDWAPETLNAEQRRDLLEIVEDRHETRSIILTSQIPVDRWYDMIGEPDTAECPNSRSVRISCDGDGPAACLVRTAVGGAAGAVRARSSLCCRGTA
jgi:hypothetical protein